MSHANRATVRWVQRIRAAAGAAVTDLHWTSETTETVAVASALAGTPPCVERVSLDITRGALESTEVFAALRTLFARSAVQSFALTVRGLHVCSNDGRALAPWTPTPRTAAIAAWLRNTLGSSVPRVALNLVDPAPPDLLSAVCRVGWMRSRVHFWSTSMNLCSYGPSVAPVRRRLRRLAMRPGVSMFLSFYGHAFEDSEHRDGLLDLTGNLLFSDYDPSE